MWRWRERTEGLGRVGLTQVDLGLDLRWVLVGWSERRVVEIGLSWSERDGFCWGGSSNSGGGGFGGDLEEAHEMVNLLLSFVSEVYGILQWRYGAVERVVAMGRETERKRFG